MSLNLKSKSKTTINNLITFAIVIVAFIVLQVADSAGLLSSVLAGQLVPICAYIIMAISLNLTVGILGELSLGHAGFMSIGAFAGVFFTVSTADSLPPAISYVLAILIGTIAAGIMGFLIGIPVLRLQGDYLAIVTLAFGEIIKNVLNSFYVGRDSNGFHVSFENSTALGLEADGNVIINGAMGITGIPRLSTFAWGFVFIMIALFITLNFIRSRTGRAVMSIRDNRIAAESVGINVAKYKIIAFTLSAALAGLAGVIYAHGLATVVARRFDYNTSILVLVFVVVGGIGNIRGSIIAAAALTILPELLRDLESFRLLIYALILILMMIINNAPKVVQLRDAVIARVKSVFKPRQNTKEGS